MSVEYRWMTNEEIESMVNPDLEKHGWASLNLSAACMACGAPLPTNRVLGAFCDGVLIESFTFQMYGMLGPMVKHQDVRDSGEISRKLASVMQDFLVGANARDYMVVANSPVSARLCERFGMKKLEVPIYAKKTGPES